MIATHRIEDEPFIGLQHISRGVDLPRGELHRQLVELHTGTGPFAVERQRNLRVVSEIEREMVRALGPHPRSWREHASGSLLECDRDDADALGHLLSRAEINRYASPAPIVYADLERDERLSVGILCHALQFAILTELAANDL